jgi:hypothetical protein
MLPLGTPLDFIIIYYCHFKNTLNKATNWFHSIFIFYFDRMFQTSYKFLFCNA